MLRQQHQTNTNMMRINTNICRSKNSINALTITKNTSVSTSCALCDYRFQIMNNVINSCGKFNQ
jgi:hypothetical protein